MINKKFLLAGRPVGRPISDDDFEYIEEEIREINDGELLLENMVFLKLSFLQLRILNLFFY